jgi:hypothetical protein
MFLDVFEEKAFCLGHETVMGKIQLFSGPPSSLKALDLTKEYSYLEELEPSGNVFTDTVYALVDLESPLIGQKGQLMIASKLDADIHQNACRLAFYGNLLEIFTEKDHEDFQNQRKKWNRRTDTG